MACEKRVLCPERVRRVPRAFSWIDHRLVRDGHISRLGHEAQALYLFLVTVADAEGLSYYSDAKAAGLLNMSEPMLGSARRQLRGAGLIAYRSCSAGRPSSPPGPDSPTRSRPGISPPPLRSNHRRAAKPSHARPRPP